MGKVNGAGKCKGKYNCKNDMKMQGEKENVNRERNNFFNCV